MASTITPTPQGTPMTLITLKVSHNGNTRRFKLPLQDVGVNSLESKLREILKIPDEAEAVFERYSDSAASFVTLDQQNVAVYKQLFRAARAKHKLKLRVTTKQQAPVPAEEPQLGVPVPSPVEEEKEGPKPASVSDEAEEESTTETTQETVVEPAPAHQDSENTTKSEESLAPIPSVSSELSVNSPSVLDPLSTELATLVEHVKETQRTCAEVRLENEATVEVLPSPLAHAPYRATFAVCCNQCEQNIPEAHYHCSTCDDGDFDLCQECVDKGVTCYSPSHWLIKRFIKNGVIINSTTERLAPKQKQKPQPAEEPIPAAGSAERIIPVFNGFLYSSTRTCNCCVQEFPEVEFVHCATCDDFDLCRGCFAKDRHGHHPRHSFVPAVAGTRFEPDVAKRLEAGRGQLHNAICDACDKPIVGIRHKCLDCPDWDYCNSCVPNASHIHPGHRFVPVYEPLEFVGGLHFRATSRATHVGICCDGPLCRVARENTTYITGDRYKCAVCHDLDFCEACEASPANNHNKTHPLIKFKTPVRHVSVTTTGENQHGRVMPAMGDRPRRTAATSSRATETTSSPVPVLSSNVQTVIDVKPSEPIIVKAPDVPGMPESLHVKEPLTAVYIRDTIPDGTLMAPDHAFEQTWVLRNTGKAAWPAGCSVKFVGGDYMGDVDSSHPAATQVIQESNQSTCNFSPVLPGEEHAFTVLMRTPMRSGRIVSNWRLSTPAGTKFGHRLWCDVVVERPKVVLPPAVVEPIKEAVKAEPEPVLEESQMIFPKLEKESPMASMIEETKGGAKSEPAATFENYEDCEDEEWDVAGSDEGFLTDEEYDILDASDEEYTEARTRK